jgi:para-aminobenzoate synthetase/4-amino-4-deoxychorismate lyase
MDSPYLTGRLYPIDAAHILRELKEDDCFVFLETARVTATENASYLFRRPRRILTANRPEDVRPLHRSMEEALLSGYYLAGWWAYEWGYALEPRLHRLLETRRPEGPLVWLGVFDSPSIWHHRIDGPSPAPGSLPDIREVFGPLDLDTDKDQYLKAIERIKDYIARGETYQVNYTIRGKFRYTGDPVDLYLALRAQQAVSYAAILRCGSRWICSLSPELFLRLDRGKIVSRPMKGTLGRGRTVDEDRKLARFLSNDPKNRAENVMIVDLLRNDIGRISTNGSVKVPELFTVERYETLFQMTSTVEGHIAPGTTWEDVFRAAFPCGSVTGAPKIRTMEIIAEIETSPRGVYTGSVGCIAPDRRAVLNVAIRTVDLIGETAELGIGGGITADSKPDSEYEECGLKARFLARPLKKFSLVETMRWDPEPDGGFSLLDRHLRRLAQSAHYFSFPLDLEMLRAELARLSTELTRAKVPQRVRLLVHRDGSFDLTASPLAPTNREVEAGLSAVQVDSADIFLYHKTTYRPIYRQEYQRAVSAGLFDCVFMNERAELTEGAISNIFLDLGEGLVTPPVSCGLLDGTLRQELLSQGEARERILYSRDLESATAFYLGNSVRGLVRVRYRSTLSPAASATKRVSTSRMPSSLSNSSTVPVSTGKEP